MKVLMITTDYPTIIGGISSLAFQVTSCLARLGHEVEVVAPSWPGHRKHDAADPCRVFRVPGYNLGYLRAAPLLAMATARLVRRPPDFVLAMTVAYGGLFMLALRTLGIRIPYAVFAHGLEFVRYQGSPLMRRLYRRAYGGAERVYANSFETRRRLLEFGVGRPEAVEVMWPGVDDERFTPPDGKPSELRARLELEGRPVILTVSRLVERKGHDLVIRALPRVLREFPRAAYLVVGDGPHRPRLEALSRELGVEGALIFAGEASEEALPDTYRAGDIFVMPSREIRQSGHVEGFGIVLLEAAACGRPVIGGRSGGVVEALDHGRTGLLVDPEDPEAVAEALLDLLRNPARAEAMGRAGRARVEQRFTYPGVLAPLGDLLAGRRAP